LLRFVDGYASSLGLYNSKCESSTDKTCLKSHLVNPARDLTYFRKMAIEVSRLKKWGAALGNATIVRGFNSDPEEMPLIDNMFWQRSVKFGGYGRNTKDSKKISPLSLTFAASRDQGGFGSIPSKDAPNLRLGTLQKGVARSLKYAMDAHHTHYINYINGLTTNFLPRLKRDVFWWCDTHMDPLPLAQSKARVFSIVSAVMGTPCLTSPPPAALPFIAEHHTRLFGKKGGGVPVKVDEKWLTDNLDRALVATAYMLKTAEDAWDKEAEDGRVVPWRDFSALRATGVTGVYPGPVWEKEEGEEEEVEVEAEAEEEVEKEEEEEEEKKRDGGGEGGGEWDEGDEGGGGGEEKRRRR